MPVDLASCRKRSAHSRSCETLPGSASTSGAMTDWIESMMATLARLDEWSRRWCPRRSRSGTADSWASGACVWRAGRPGRRTLRPRRTGPVAGVFGDLLATWLSNVDLPTPGSPPISVTEPLTMPPPRTRATSLDATGGGRSRPIDVGQAQRAAAAGAMRGRCRGVPARGWPAWRTRRRSPRRRTRGTGPASAGSGTRTRGRQTLLRARGTD